MTSTTASRESIGTVVAIAIVVVAWAVLTFVATALTPFAMSRSTLLGFGIYVFVCLPFIGISAIAALRARSEGAVRVVAMLLPALWIATLVMQPRFQPIDVGVPLGMASGVFAGMWVGTSIMHGGGRGRIIAGFVAAAFVGGVVTVLIAVPALVLHSATTN